MNQGSQSELLHKANTTGILEVVISHWFDRSLSTNELKMVEEMMILAVDHGPDSPSAQATIKAATEGQDVLRSVEAGVHEINERHGGAVEGLAQILQSDDRDPEEIVSEALKNEVRLPGFGHRLYKDEDPRTSFLFKRAVELGLSSKFLDKARAIEAELEKQKGTKLVINIDGAMAAILSELGVEPKLTNAFFLWPRVAGLVYRWKEGRK